MMFDIEMTKEEGEQFWRYIGARISSVIPNKFRHIKNTRLLSIYDLQSQIISSKLRGDYNECNFPKLFVKTIETN